MQKSRGCTEPGRLSAWSITDPKLEPPSEDAARRCKAAPLNPDTDLYDPHLAQAIHIARDVKTFGMPWAPGGLRDQTAKLIDVMRILESVDSTMIAKYHDSLRRKNG